MATFNSSMDLAINSGSDSASSPASQLSTKQMPIMTLQNQLFRTSNALWVHDSSMSSVEACSSVAARLRV